MLNVVRETVCLHLSNLEDICEIPISDTRNFTLCTYNISKDVFFLFGLVSSGNLCQGHQS